MAGAASACCCPESCPACASPALACAMPMPATAAYGIALPMAPPMDVPPSVDPRPPSTSEPKLDGAVVVGALAVGKFVGSGWTFAIAGGTGFGVLTDAPDAPNGFSG